MAETPWEGAQLHIADTLVRLDALRGRCPMTTVDPDTLERDPEVLQGYRPPIRRPACARCRRGARRNGAVGDDVVIDRFDDPEKARERIGAAPTAS